MFVAPLTLTSRYPGDNCDRWRTESPQTSLYWGNYCSDQDASPETDREPSLLRKTTRKYTIDLIKNLLLQYHPYTVACGRLGTPCRICENVNNFNKIREIIQNACYFLFSTVLSKMFPSGASVNVWTFFNSCVWVHQLSSVWKDGSQNHTVTAGKGSNMQRCWKTEESAGHGGFFWRTVLSLTIQNKQGTHEQPVILISAIFVLWTICKHLLCKRSYSGQY